LSPRISLAATAVLTAGLTTTTAPFTAPATAAPPGTGWVTGVVVDRSGDPVEGALVNALPPREIPEFGMLDETTDRWDVTGADGRFRVRQHSAGFLVQVCDADPDRTATCVRPTESDHLIRYVGPDGAFDSWLQHTDLYDATPTDLAVGAIEVQPTARIEGTLAGAGHQTIEVMRLNDTVAFHGQTDKLGDFSIQGLAPGTYYLRAGGFGTVPWRSDPVTIDAETPGHVIGELDAGTAVVGRAVEEATGTPARRTEIFLADGDGDLIASLFTTRRGSFRFTGLTPGDYRVGVLRPGGVFLRHVERVTVAAGDERVETTVPLTRGATATVRLTGTEGRVDSELRDSRGNVLHTNLIREDGLATYPGLRRGTYTLVAKDDDDYGLRTFRVRGLRSYDLGRLRLTKPLLTLRGRTAPRAVVEATTSDLCPADASPTLGGFHEIEKADAQGRYVIRGLVPGDAWMVAADGFPHNYAPVCHDDVKIWSSRHYDVPLAAGHSATGRLVYEGTDLPVITNIGYEVLYPAGLTTNPTDEHPTRARTRGATGEFTITRLSEGTATGGLAVTPSDDVFARSLWVFFPYQYGTPYWLEAYEEPVIIDGDIDLGDVELSLQDGSAV
jgi:hypothetical protein